MNATTTATAYRAQTDAGTKKWHLGTVSKDNVCLCGAKLMFPGDTRAFALKVPAEARNYTTSDDLAKVTCGACLKNREYLKAATSAEAAAQSAAHEASHPAATRPRRRAAQSRGLHPEAADQMAEAAAAATPQGPAPRKTRKSRASRANERQQADQARREALTADADATVAAIEAAVAEVTPE